MEKSYDVALSFAGEDRPYVGQVAEYVRKRGVKVFYDSFFDVELWGKDLVETLDVVYRKETKLVVMFVSQAYLKKEWTNFERKSALAGALKSHSEYVLPVRFDDTELPGLPPTIAYKDARKTSAEALSKMIVKKIGLTDARTPQRDGIVAWRLTAANFGVDLSGKGAALIGGAWNNPGVPAVYCSYSYCAAVLERFIAFPSFVHKEMLVTQLLIPPGLSIQTIYEDALPSGWRTGEALNATRQIGHNWLTSGLNCILSVPSRVVPYERYLVLNPRHPEFQHIKVGQSESMHFPTVQVQG